MRFDRAQQILNSADTIDVNYQGNSVWITDLNASTQTAQVRMPMNSENIVVVPVKELIER